MNVSNKYDDIIAKLDILGEIQDIIVRIIVSSGGNEFTGDSGTESYTDYSARGFGKEITDLIQLFGTEYNKGDVALEILKEGLLTTLSEHNTIIIIDSKEYDILNEPIPFYMGGVHKSWYVRLCRRF